MWNFKPNFKCWPLKFLRGPPTPSAMCATKAWSNSSACKNFRTQQPLGAEIIVCRKSRFGWVQTHMYYFMDSGPKFTGLVWLNAGGIARDHMSFRFLISCLDPEIFAIKVGSCEKSVQILHVFGLPNFLGEDPPKFLTCIKKMTHMLITVQSFAAIGRRSSEILCLVKKI